MLKGMNEEISGDTREGEGMSSRNVVRRDMDLESWE